MRNIFTIGITFFVMICASGSLLSQDRSALKLLEDEAKEIQEGKEARVNQYLEATGRDRWYITNEGVGYYLDDVTPTGQPLYLRTHNRGAAATVGVDKLRQGGGLGLNLTGQGMRVGIWEVFGVFQNHQEFGNRVLTQDAASSIDNHATHVAGTIMASGLNPDAQGMAPDAKAWLYTASGDVGEMASVARPGQGSMLVSNHSYGPAAGWEFSNGNWSWFGNQSVDDQEDYRFGFYDSKARQIDNLAFEAPYFTIVKSAGNDRSDVGDGTRPADGPYDIIASFGVSKNIVTVGAVEKINGGYTGPEDVQISSFSSWGPTDDGRIKPDIVAAGVSLTSSISTTDTSYGNLSGTSMSAPNAAGAFLLLQQLAKQETDNYMRTATLKALITHTANPANNAGGPDYRHGWGLLNASGAAEFLLAREELGNYMRERILNDGQTHRIAFNPQPNTKVTATISWTDPAGSVSEISVDPTDLKLVNDLDIRIVDEAGNEALPWILDPATPGRSAQRGDNFRDNIEKIEFSNTEPRKYTLVVSHKGSLQGNSQAYSVILSYTPRFENNDRNVFYWIGNDGEWSNGSNWSLSSGGTPANEVPTGQDRVVFDENSFDGQGQAVTLSSNAQVYSLDWLQKGNSSISLEGNQITVLGSLLVSSNTFAVSTGGTILMAGSEGFNLGGNDLPEVDLVFNEADGLWNIGGTLVANSINLRNGEIDAQGATIAVDSINISGSGNKVLDLSTATINGLESFLISGTGLALNARDARINFSEGSSIIDAPGTTIDANLIKPSGLLELSGEGLIIDRLDVSGDFTIADNVEFNTLRFAGDADVSFDDGLQVNITELWEIDPGSNVIMASPGSATVNVEAYAKFCFDDMTISNVNYTGEARVTVGTNSTLENASGWLEQACDDVLFSNFTFDFNCVNGLTYFLNESSGNIVSYLWDFGDGAVSEDQDAYHVFGEENTYNVTLTIINGNSSVSYTQTVDVGPNEEFRNTVVQDGDRLVSERPSSSYQWFRNGQPVEGETERIYTPGNLGGEFFVTTLNESGCNNVSSSFFIEVTGIEDLFEDEQQAEEVQIFPIPVKDDLNIRWPQGTDRINVSLLDIYGRLLYTNEIIPESGIFVVPMRTLPTGLYWLKVENARGTFVRKLIK